MRSRISIEITSTAPVYNLLMGLVFTLETYGALVTRTTILDLVRKKDWPKVIIISPFRRSSGCRSTWRMCWRRSRENRLLVTSCREFVCRRVFEMNHRQEEFYV